MAGHPQSPDQQRPLSPDARAIAIEVLRRVDQEEAWASRALDAELKRRSVSGRDAALCAEIVYGVLRTLPALDARIEAQALSLWPRGRAHPAPRCGWVSISCSTSRGCRRTPP